VGRDPRASGEMLEAALIAGLATVGVDVLKVGVLPTPAIAYLTKYYGADLGIVLSASHNVFSDNGVKFFSKDGKKLPDEVEDQIDAAKVLGKYNYIDASRIGIFGWSYGGFMSSNCLFQGADVFKMAIAVAPVTSWRYYDSIYTERYMQTPQENASGYDNNSPINHVSKLKGNFLLVHGTADDNVHVQNTMKMVEALVQANKQFDWAIYPDKNHGIYGGKTRLQLYTKMTNFIKEKL
jgi:dipeptidyl aminopeptidase/acylaminoacyl peptidase